MQITLANPSHISDVVAFFNENLDRHNSAVYSEEFFCPFGIKAAIKRKQLIVATIEGQVVGAFRFYRKKTQNQISLYQFAISDSYRGKGLLNKMLKTINDLPIVAFCPKSSTFNEYYQKTEWELQGQNEEFKTWVFNF